MTPADRAAQLGTEHGTQAAEAWLKQYGPHSIGRTQATDFLNGRTQVPSIWPQPSSHEDGTVFYFAKIDESGDQHHECVAVYSEMFRAAVEATIRAKCEEVTQ